MRHRFQAAPIRSIAQSSRFSKRNISQSTAPPEKRYAPNHPLADKDGYIFAPPIDQNAEMIDMLETSRQYQNNIEVLSTAKTLLIKTLNVGK
jgi:flagellar basal-body rod protein FlgC